MFQDLLQLQYEGVAVIELFNDAKVNVNLLIFLLNKKFYSAGKWSIQDVQEFPKELENILAFSMCNKLLELVSNIIDLSQIVMLWHCEGKAACMQSSQDKHVTLHCDQGQPRLSPFLALFYAILNYMLHGHEYLYPVFEYHSLNMCKLHVDLLFAKNLKFVLQSGNEINTCYLSYYLPNFY